MKKLYCVPLQLSGKFPIGFRPTADEHLSIEIGGSTLAPPQSELRMNDECQTEILVKGWVVLCTNMDREGLRLFLDRNMATVRTEEGEAELEDVITVFASDQMLVIDLDAMNAEVHHV
jgi:hypothetical protein